MGLSRSSAMSPFDRAHTTSYLTLIETMRLSCTVFEIQQAINKANIGCRIGANCTAIFLYVDDVILLAPSVQALQSLVDICASELEFLDMAINVGKSACASAHGSKMPMLILLYLVILSNGRCRLDILAYIQKAVQNLSARFPKTKRNFLKVF